jgi:hypothetical protein
VKWLNADVGSVQAALQQRPEVFEAISVNLPIDVLDCVIDHLMLKLIQTLV